MTRWISIMVIITGMLKAGLCKINGVTALACLDMFPVHGTARQQDTPSPIHIHLGVSSFLPNQTINVTLSAPDGRSFIGVILNVYRQAGETDELIGHFGTFPDNKTKTGSCSGGSVNYLTHTNAVPVPKMEATWTAPSYEVGNVTFRATFVESFSVFWINVLKDLQSDGQTPTRSPIKEMIYPGSVNIDLDNCGATMGCMLYPSYCSRQDCDMGVTYQISNHCVSIQMWAWTTQQGAYVSVGFSSDKRMGDDQTVTCTQDNGKFSFQYGITEGQKPHRQSKKGRLTGMSAMYRDGKLYCTFTIPFIMNATLSSGGSVTYDLGNPYHLMLATGQIYDGTHVIMKHDELPITSHDKINLNKYEIHRASALALITQIHGILMLIAWVLFVGITTVVARYYKPIFPGKLFCGTNFWFQVHRGSAVLSFIMTAASFILIFIKVDGLSDRVGVHSWLGITLMCGVSLQLLGGLLRPDQDSKTRSVFNIVHWCLGKSLHALAAVTCLVVFNAEYLPRAQGQLGIIMLCIWIVVQGTWELLFEANKRCTPNDDKAKSGIPTIRTAMLFCFISTMAAMLISLSMTIFLF